MTLIISLTRRVLQMALQYRNTHNCPHYWVYIRDIIYMTCDSFTTWFSLCTRSSMGYWHNNDHFPFTDIWANHFQLLFSDGLAKKVCTVMHVYLTVIPGTALSGFIHLSKFLIIFVGPYDPLSSLAHTTITSHHWPTLWPPLIISLHYDHPATPLW